jgi:hypothetical protein
MPDQFLSDEDRSIIANIEEIPSTVGQKTEPEITPLGKLQEKRLLESGADPTLVKMLKQDRQSIVDEREFERAKEDFEPSSEEAFRDEQEQLARAKEMEEWEPVDPVSIWDVDTLAKDENFSLEAYLSENPEAIHDERSEKLREVWRKTNMEPITTKDVAIGTFKLPWTTGKTIYKLGRGVGQVLVDVFGTPVAGLAGDLTGQDPGFHQALHEISQKELSEDLAGLEQGTFGFAQFMERTRRNLPRRLGVTSWEDIPDEQLQTEFANHFEGYLQQLRIGEGEGVVQQAIGGEILKEVRARGDVLDRERVNNVAEADPMGFLMFGQMFRAGFAGAGAVKRGVGRGVSKLPPVKQARDLNVTRNNLEKFRNTLPPGEPVRDLADDLLKAATERTGKGAQALERMFQIGDAANRLVEAGVKVRTLENAAKAFGTGERQAALAEAKAALVAAEEAAAAHMGARGIAGLKRLFSTVDDAGATGQQLAGRAAQAADIGLRATARTIEALPTVATAGAVGGALITGNFVGALAALGGAGLVRPLLKRSATGLAKPFRKAAEVAEAGRAAVTATGGTPFQRALQGLARGSGEAVAEGLKAVPIDVGFGLALAESPEDVQNIAGYAAAFRSLHAAGRPIARLVQAVKAGQGRVPNQFLPRKAGNIASAEAANRVHRQALSPEQRARMEATETFINEIGAESPVYVMDQPAFFKELRTQFERKNGRAPNEAELAELQNYSQQRGMFAEEVIGDNGEVGSAIFVTSPEAIPHEGAHPFQNVLGERGNQFVDQIIFDEFTGNWENIGAGYVSRLEGRPARATWRDALQSIIPERIRQEAGGDPVKAADIYLAREIGAEQFSVLFNATGGRPAAKTSLTEKLANVVDRTAAFFGHNIMEGGPTTPGLGLPVSGQATEAIRTAAQAQARRAGADGQPAPILPRESGAAPAAAPTPARPTPGAPAPGAVRVPVAPIEPVAPGVRPTPRPEDPMRAETPERLNIEFARERAAQSGDQAVIDNVEAIGEALKRSPGEAVVINAENLSVIPGRKGSAFQRTLRRAEQAVPEAAREFFSKRFAVTRFLKDRFSGKKLQLAAMSMDKVLANVFNLNERLSKKNSTDLVPYETDATGQFTESGWQQFTANLIDYNNNQANGYRGGGGEIVRPETAVQELGIAIPEVNPTYKPVMLPEVVEQYLNVVQAIPTPRTAREFKGIVPGNIKGQVLREAQGERTFDPADITPKRQAKQQFKSFPERTVQETNPLRQEMTERGVNTRELIEVTERLNLDRLRNVQVEPDLRFNLPSTDVIRAGFLPREGNVELFRGQEGTGAAAGTFFTQNRQKAASFAPDGRVFRIEVPREVAAEGKRAAEAIGQGGDTFLLKPGADRGAVEVKAETPTFQLLPAEFKAGEKIDLSAVKDMPSEKFVELSSTYQGKLGGGLTGLAFDIGAKVKTGAEVQALRDQHADIQAALAEAKAAGDFDKMFSLVSKSQFVREALEAASGEGGSEAFIQKNFDPNFTSPAKAAAAEGRQFSPVEKAGGEENAAKAWREKGVESPFFKRWFGKSQVLDESGAPKMLKHGTTHEFSEFDPNRANIESDFGKGIYFTDSVADATFNYSYKPIEGGETSPDLRLKIESRAERILFESEEGITSGEAQRLAEAELVGPVEKTIDTYVKMENPVYVGAEGRIEGAPRETRFTFEEKYDPKTEEYTGEIEGTLMPVIEALREHRFEGDIEPIIDTVMERAMENGGEITATELVKTIKEHDNATDFFDEFSAGGDLAIGEVIRRAFEDAGYDGIIDRSVSEKFPRMRGIEDATHYIAFQPTQVKGVKNVGRFDPESPKFQALPAEKPGKKQELSELRAQFIPAESLAEGVLFHSTKSEAEGRSILDSGKVKPGRTIESSEALAPMAGKVYTASDPITAGRFAIGARLGSYIESIEGKNGWVFQVKPSRKADVLLDEDIIGQIAGDLLLRPKGDFRIDETYDLSPATRQELQTHIDQLTPSQKSDLQTGELIPSAEVGKALTKKLDKDAPELVRRIAEETGSSLAFEGELDVVNAWKVPVEKATQIRHDGSNLFEVAEKVPVAPKEGSVKAEEFVDNVEAYRETVPASVREHTADTVTAPTGTLAKPDIAKPLVKSGVPVAKDGAMSGGAALQALPREWRQWLDESFRGNPEVRKHFSQKEADEFARGMEQTAKIFGDFSMVPTEIPGTPIRDNSDPMFGLTFDLTTVCPKQDQFVAITRALETERGKIFTPQEKAQVGEMLREAGQATCYICYGQAARNSWDSAAQRVADTLNRVTKVPDWKTASPETVSEAFGGLKTTGVLRKFVDENIDALREAGEVSGPRLRDVLRGNVKPETFAEELMVKPLNGVVQGIAKANEPKGFSPYTNQLLDRKMQKEIDLFNGIAGFRMNSQSDFRIWHTLDTAQFLSHLQAKGGQAHVYTRIDEMLQIFGKTGMKFNMSVEMSDPVSLPLSARVGNLSRKQFNELKKKNGDPLWDDMNSFPEARVEHWRNELPNDAGSMLVAANDYQLWWGLDSPKIDMIIPYHQGSVKAETTAFYGARDYTKDGQHEVFPSDWMPGQKRSIKLDNGDKVELTMGGRIVEKGKKKGSVVREKPLINRKIHQNNRERYLEITEKFGITPKFPRFTEHPNYMKLVRDAAREPMNQNTVDASKIDWDAAMKNVDDWVNSGAYEKETKVDKRLLDGVRKRLEQGALPVSPVIKAGEAKSLPEIIKTGKELRSKQRKTAREQAELITPKQPIFKQVEITRKEVGKRSKADATPKRKK